ncbi:MAG: glycosyltransferase family 4 protein [Woeseiaceae bacterium]|nr:glycosyltransferase family 4 protein [Woeseiaceae bacterium]
MRICHVNLASGYRGGERQAELLVRELARRGSPQRLVIRRGNDEFRRRSEDIEGLEIVEVASNPLAAAIAARGCDVVQIHEGRGVYAGWLASLLFGIPYVITRRVPNPQRPSWIRDRAYHRALSVVAISEAVAESMRPRYADIDFDIVPDAHAALEADPDAVRALRERFQGKTVIGHVGALDHAHKGQRTIIEAAHQVRDRHPDWQFVLCGSGRDEAAFRDAIGDFDNILLEGFVDNVGDYYASFDLFVFPSLKEAIGSAMIDAMYFGLPVVGSNVDGIPEFLEDGVNGRLIEPENPEQLIAGIETVIDRPDWTASVRAANREKAMTLDAAAMADRYSVIYERL